VKALVILLALAIPLRAHAKGCHEVSGVVGYERCTYFGTWSRDTDVVPLWIDLTYFHHDFVSEPYTLDAASQRQLAPGSLATTAQGPMFRILAGRLLYAGVELGGGWISHMPEALGGAPPAWGSILTGHVVGGVHVALWRFGAGVEAAAGGRMEVLASCDAHDPRCMQTQDTQTRRELELRGHVDLFVTPQWSFGLMMGRSVIDRDDTQFMITMGMHYRALDGAP
jgi:hypothetical protein